MSSGVGMRGRNDGGMPEVKRPAYAKSKQPTRPAHNIHYRLPWSQRFYNLEQIISET